MAKILVVDDEIGIRELLLEILNDEGHSVCLASNASMARDKRDSELPDLVLLDIWMPDIDGISLLKEWAANGKLTMPVIMMSGHGTINTAVEAVRVGALDFLEKPISLQKLLATINKALTHQTTSPRPLLITVGQSPVIQEFRKNLEQLFASKNPLLLLGEPGSMREPCARWFHRSCTPWIKFDSKHLAKPLELLEQAANGIIFVEELADLGKSQRYFFSSLIGHLNSKNVRLISTTIKNVSDLELRRFDSEFLDAMSTLTIPPLRTRKEDIPDIAHQFLLQEAKKKNTPLKHFSKRALDCLCDYDWPSNEEQLEQVVKKTELLSQNDEITEEEVEQILNRFDGKQRAIGLSLDLPLREAREHFEKIYFENLLNIEKSNIARIAEKCGLERTHLYRKLKQLGINYRGIGDRE